MVKTINMVLSMGLAALTHSSALQARDTDESPVALTSQATAMLKKNFPDMKQVQAKNINRTSCKLHKQSEPGLVMKDFNGDGIKDYAVLLISTAVKRAVKWEGKDWPVHDVALVVLMGKKDDTFDFKTLYAQEDSLPTIYYIRPQPKGELREVGTGKVIKIHNYGVTLSACEKFAVVYFFDGSQFRMVGIEG